MSEASGDELEIKRQTLQLERDKFRYDKVLKFQERLCDGLTRAANALIIANGTALLAAMSYNKQMSDLVGARIFGYSVMTLLFGMIFAIMAYVDAISMRAGTIDLNKEDAISSSWRFIGFSVSAIASLSCFLAAVAMPVNQVFVPPDWALIHGLGK